jgi:hypothetical protein
VVNNIFWSPSNDEASYDNEKEEEEEDGDDCENTFLEVVRITEYNITILIICGGHSCK